jgi:hypothetical protein
MTHRVIKKDEIESQGSPKKWQIIQNYDDEMIAAISKMLLNYIFASNYFEPPFDPVTPHSPGAP